MTMFADGTQAADDFVMTQGDDAYIDIVVKDETTKQPVSVVGFANALWELEAVETQISKSLQGGGIVRMTDSTFRVWLDATDTADLRGLYSHQLRLVDAQGDQRVVLSGTGRFDAQVF